MCYISCWGITTEVTRLNDSDLNKRTEGTKETKGRKNIKIRSHKDLEVYNLAFKVAMDIFKISKKFPKEEKYSITDQIRRSSRSVCANIAEAFRKRRYPKAFVSKLSDAEGEAAETQVWLDFCKECDYIDHLTYNKLFQQCENIIGKNFNMSLQPEKWKY